MTNNIIGVLDSGVGGLSVLSQMNVMMPEFNYIYFGDTKNMPYGTKTSEQLYEYTKKILEFFCEENVSTVVFACNTTSATVYDKLSVEYQNKLKIYPVIQNAIVSSLQGLKDNDTIGILATNATIKSDKYKIEIQKQNNKINVVNVDCTGFVEIVEDRLYNDPKSIDLIKSKLEILKKANAKRAILGCTHYPYLIDIFKKYLDIDYFNPAYALAEKIKEDLKTTKNQKGSIRFCTSKSPKDFILSAKTFFDVKKAELVEL